MENVANPDCRATPSIAVNPSGEVAPGSGFETIPDLLMTYGAFDNIDLIYRLHEIVKGVASGAGVAIRGHQWDDVGERCMACGDKDWFAGPNCSGGVDADETNHGPCAQGDCDEQ